MTEQEKREKRIEEMERDVEEALNVPICDDSGTVYGVQKTTSTPVIAARLISKGYRKAEEVQKETAREIADWLDNNVFRIKEFREFLKRKFGVEVDE